VAARETGVEVERITVGVTGSGLAVVTGVCGIGVIRGETHPASKIMSDVTIITRCLLD
jgi:hypothetical protein